MIDDSTPVVILERHKGCSWKLLCAAPSPEGDEAIRAHKIDGYAQFVKGGPGVGTANVIYKNMATNTIFLEGV
jgi:hypothetical protein